MAKTLKLSAAKAAAFEAAAAKPVRRQAKYPWAEWLSGELTLLERHVFHPAKDGEEAKVKEARDFEEPLKRFVAVAKSAARKQYKTLTTWNTDPDGHKLSDAVIVRAKPMDAQERAAEDSRRKGRKALVKIGREAAKEARKAAREAGKSKEDVKKAGRAAAKAARAAARG